MVGVVDVVVVGVVVVVLVMAVVVGIVVVDVVRKTRAMIRPNTRTKLDSLMWVGMPRSEPESESELWWGLWVWWWLAL